MKIRNSYEMVWGCVMGRVSKRKKTSILYKTPILYNKTSNGYRAGAYIRLSSAYGSASVSAQLEIIKNYISEHNESSTDKNMEANIELIRSYTDIGKTGSSFERSGFLKLLEDITSGEIDCVIVKDLSRFGRNYLEAGYYIESVFPAMGVRFISVTDDIDTARAGIEQKLMLLQIKNLVNDMYARDFSKKAKLHLKQKREEGSYVGGPSPYGYIATFDGRKRVLKPDKAVLPIVHFIFENFLDLRSCTAVAAELSRRRINPPCVYKKTGDVYYAGDFEGYRGWNKSAVNRILDSKTYIGQLVQGKTAVTARNEKNRIYRPEEEWVITGNAHEPLIDRELFYKVQSVKEKSSRKKGVLCQNEEVVNSHDKA